MHVSLFSLLSFLVLSVPVAGRGGGSRSRRCAAASRGRRETGSVDEADGESPPRQSTRKEKKSDEIQSRSVSKRKNQPFVNRNEKTSKIKMTLESAVDNSALACVEALAAAALDRGSSATSPSTQRLSRVGHEEQREREASKASSLSSSPPPSLFARGAPASSVLDPPPPVPPPGESPSTPYRRRPGR